MNKEETTILTKCVEAMTLMSNRLDTMFKATEVIQEQTISLKDATPKEIPGILKQITDLYKANINLTKVDTLLIERFKELNVWKTKLNDMDRILLDRIEDIDEQIKPIKDNYWKFKSWDSNIKKICEELNELRNEDRHLSNTCIDKFSDSRRRLDRLEEMMYHLCDSIDKKEDDNTYYKLIDQQGFLKEKAKEIYEEQAAFKGDQDE